MASMGMGLLADPTTIFKRKFRWGLTIETGCRTETIPEYLVKVASRPNLAIEETEINSKNGKMYIPGKASWETITVTFYDVSGKSVRSDIGKLYNWIISVYDFMNPGGLRGELHMADSVHMYAGKATLSMYSGCGNILEKWTLLDAWPSAVNFGDLDYSSSEEATIELTLRYSNVIYSGEGCSTITRKDCCESC